MAALKELKHKNHLDLQTVLEPSLEQVEDLQIYHDGSHTYINNGTGHVYFQQSADDMDIVFQCDDGSGGVTEYFRLDGSEAQNRFSKHVKLSDSVELRIGTDNDLKLMHSGSHAVITNATGNIDITNNTNDGDIFIKSDDGSGGVATYIQVDGGTGAVNLRNYGNVKLATTSSGITVTGAIAETTHGTILDSSANLTNINNVYASGYRIGSTQIVDSSRNLTNIGTISSGAITASGKIKASGSRFESTTTDNSHREYVLTTGSGGGDFFLGQIEYNDAADGAIDGIVYFAYDYGSSTDNSKLHFSFAQRNGTARGTWWYEHDDDDEGSDNVKVVLIDDGSGGMFVWVRVGDYGRVAVVAETRHGSNWASSGSLTAGTITTGTTLFDTSNDPTSEFHIGKLFAHDHIKLHDNDELRIGDGVDFRILHNGSNTFVDQQGTGDYILEIRQTIEISYSNQMIRVVAMLLIWH